MRIQGMKWNEKTGDEIEQNEIKYILKKWKYWIEEEIMEWNELKCSEMT